MVNPINLIPEVVQVELEEKEAQWQKYVKEGKELVSNLWKLGDLVEHIAKDARYGEGAIRRFANEIGIKSLSLYHYWRTARTFPPEYRAKWGDDVSFYHFYELACSGVGRKKWDEMLHRVVQANLSVEKFGNLLDSLTRKEDEGRKKSIVGKVINFRGLVYGPINENGVIFLFGKVVEDLNMYVEEIKPGFPDCIGRRRINKGWEKVRIEFEYKSSEFKKHNHDPKDCDLIICWEHDWPDCPLEVIELKEEIKSLPNEPIYT